MLIEENNKNKEEKWNKMDLFSITNKNNAYNNKNNNNAIKKKFNFNTSLTKYIIEHLVMCIFICHS